MRLAARSGGAGIQAPLFDASHVQRWRNGTGRPPILDRNGGLAVVGHSAGIAAAVPLLGRCEQDVRTVWVDATYRGRLLRWVAYTLRVRLDLVRRRDKQRGSGVQPRRWIVERTFAWLTHCRRLSKDYEVLRASRVAMIHLAMTRLWCVGWRMRNLLKQSL